MQAWQRIVRVIGHELNNSLTPIKSIAQSLGDLLVADPRPADWEQDMSRGLKVIATRSESLSRFMSSYARLAKLPPPKLAPIEINSLLVRASSLETRQRVFFEEGPPLTFQGDIDQLEQALINLIQNGVDASEGSGGHVFLRYRTLPSALEITVRDEGPGSAEHGEFVCAILYHQARWVRHRPGAEPADCRGA